MAHQQTLAERMADLVEHLRLRNSSDSLDRKETYNYCISCIANDPDVAVELAKREQAEQTRKQFAARLDAKHAPPAAPKPATSKAK